MKNQLFQRWKSILTSITKEDVVVVFSDNDPDGLTSGTLVAKAVERLRQKPIDDVFIQLTRNNPLNDEFIAKLQLLKTTYFITTDASLEKYDEQLEKIAQFASVVVFDHHKIYNTIDHPKITIIKSQYINPEVDASQYCTAKLVYDLTCPIVPIEDLDWLCAIGVLADSNYKTYKEFVDRIFTKYGIPIVKEVFTTPVGRAASLIGYANSYGADMKTVFQKIYHSSSLQEVRTALQEYDVVGQELQRLIHQHTEKAQFFDDVMMYEVTPKFKLGSIVSTVISCNFYPDKTVILISDMGDEWLHISARRQDHKKKMNELLEKSIQDCTNANAGGHAPASGATILKKDKELFMKQLRENLL